MLTPREIDELEFKRESAAILERALAYAARKRADEKLKVFGVPAKVGNFGNRTPSKRNRKCREYEINGIAKPLNEWCEEFKIKKGTVLVRMRRGAFLQEALTRPVGKSTGKSRGREPTLYTLNGVTRSLTAWAQSTGINRSTLNHRMWRGMTFEVAISFGRDGRRRTRRTGDGSELSPVG